ncbi:DUF2071 domain-containing protein [Williamsia sp. M5A3_1d]
MSLLGRMNSTIERRLLIYYRVDPSVAAQWLPDGFRLQLVDGVAIAGICMIRLARMAPPGVPAVLGWRGENAAQRIAVEWDDNGHTARGVFITRRFSASSLAVAAGGRLFPGAHTKAAITSDETHDRIAISLRTATTPAITVDADVAVATSLTGSVFPTVSDASEFFRAGSTGYSPAHRANRLDGLRLDTDDWRVEPTTPIQVRSTLFDDLPAGAAELDSVLLMRDVRAAWNPVAAPTVGGRESLRV